MTAEYRDNLFRFGAVVLVGFLVAEAIWIYATIVQFWGPAQDFFYYRNLGVTFLETGQFYLPRQLEGPYEIFVMYDVLYPPSALLLFVPLALLPVPLAALAWWGIPTLVTLYVIWGLRPRPWTYPVMLLLLMWPRANGAFLFGNSDMWAMLGVASGIRWGWPAVLLLLKPTFAPFALVGVRKREWWVALVMLGAFGVLQFPLWLDYVTAMRNTTLDPFYSAGSLALVSVPLVAWLGRQAPTLDASRKVALRREPAFQPDIG